MDPERTFLRVHTRFSVTLSQLLTPRIRMALEYASLGVAVALLFLIVVMHNNFVQQPGCSRDLLGIEFSEAQLVQIKITSAGLWILKSDEPQGGYFRRILTDASAGPKMSRDEITLLSPMFWSNWLGCSRKNKLIFKSWKNDKELLEPQAEKAIVTSSGVSSSDSDNKMKAKDLYMEQPVSVRVSYREAIFQLCNKLKAPIVSFWSSAKKFSNNSHMFFWIHAGWNAFLEIPKSFHRLRFEHLKTFSVQWLEKRSKGFEPAYLYTVEKGLFLLPEGAKSRYNIRTVNVTLSAQNSCFGNWWEQLLINTIVGYDTILMNSLMNLPGHGYLYNLQTKEFYDLTYRKETSDDPARFGDFFISKFGVLIMSLFVFFTTTISVSFTLRETQSRMLKFTVQLQHHARNHLPTFQLIFVHVIESLVFVPVMIGILFFLSEFYDDQLLAFFVLALVWLCELFMMISVQTPISMQFFPRFFLLYFLVFHIYFFSYAYGFSYLAFSATAAFMLHLILYFWNRFEVPALQRFMRARAHLQQHQTSIQFGSYALYPSTLHLAGAAGPEFGMPNPTFVDDESPSRAGSPLLYNPVNASDPVGASQSTPVPDLNSQETETTTSSNSLELFGSPLLGTLGVVSPESIVSFFATFRDFHPENEPLI